MSSNVASPVKSSPSPAAPLKAERVQLRLKEIPGWNLSIDSRQLRRQFVFVTRREAAAFVQSAMAAFEKAPVALGSCGPAVLVRGAVVKVAIWAHGGAYSESDLALAQAVGKLS